MEAKQKKIVEFLALNNTQFTIPVYQRNYNWVEQHCKVLFNDIIEAAVNEQVLSHFLGSIVYIHEGVYSTSTREFSIIDGQQRLTTINLLLCALYTKAKELNHMDVANMVYNRYLIDPYMSKKEQSKLVPVGDNYVIYHKLLNYEVDEVLQHYPDHNMTLNYIYFKNKIKDISDIDKVLIGIEKLIYVDTALEKGKDDPQRIFESLNSTGLDLSQGDLIRNYILMNLDRENQQYIYENYWTVLEENTKIYKSSKIYYCISEFIRDYLTLKFGKIPNQSKVFNEFKEKYIFNSFEDLKQIMQDIVKYSDIYAKLLNPMNESDKDLRKQFSYLKSLDQSVINPFILGVYYDYLSSVINKSTLIEVFELVQSYLLRRYICNEKTNTLNKIFMNLYGKIKVDHYYESIEEALVRTSFPDDKQLKIDLKLKPVYKDREKLMYIFDRIENTNHPEFFNIYQENITIEHIFPQKPSIVWEKCLSEAEFDKMLELKDTISNLTLTGSNSSLGNKSFIEKRDMPVKGFKDSKLSLNSWICEQEEWNLEKLESRFDLLYQSIITIWKMPKGKNQLDVKDLLFYCKSDRAYGKAKFLSEKKFLILEGSKASKTLMESAKNNFLKLQKLKEQGIVIENKENYIFVKDYVSTSPSAAAKLILGRSANGWAEWKTYEGELLDSYREEREV